MLKLSRATIGFLLLPSLSFAVDLYQYHPDSTCALKKFVVKKWSAASDSEVQGERFALANPGKNNASFKVKDVWYNAKSTCLSKTNQDSKTQSALKRMYVELRGTYNLMMGSGTGATSQTLPSGAVESSSNYTSGLGYGARFGIMLDPKKAIFLEISHFTGGVTGTIGATSGTQTETIWSFDLGYQYYFSQSSFKPFAGLEAGISLLSGTDSFPATPLSVTYSATDFNLGIEAGALCQLNNALSLVGSLKFTLLSIPSAKINTSNDAINYPVGATLSNGMSYNHLGVNLGMRLAF